MEEEWERKEQIWERKREERALEIRKIMAQGKKDGSSSCKRGIAVALLAMVITLIVRVGLS